MNRIILTNAATNLARKAIVRTERKDIYLQFLTVVFSIIYRLPIGILMEDLSSIVSDSMQAMDLKDLTSWFL
ncbi:MAG: hypothetical protein QGF78_05990 [Candidatus Bathyarchaeota archaeon]|nr:hypothetical protein [Candidatus Bathyarchaeota archaeon]